MTSHTQYQLWLHGPISKENRTTFDADNIDACSDLCCNTLTCDVAVFVDKVNIVLC